MFSRARVLHRPVSVAPRARLGAFAVPMTSFVDRDVVKAALALSCVDPSLSVLVRGGRGSGKSTLCRSVASVVPNKRFVTVPLGVTDERVLGSVDVEASARSDDTIDDGDSSSSKHFATASSVAFFASTLADASLSVAIAAVASSAPVIVNAEMSVGMSRVRVVAESID